ncbi:hypothetical protein [Nitrosomonas halophila]|uniref:Uncharacterized protein n=1 Tax=Nitrosomonas halophila TaxID=44576 RepID=A0A1H3I160_9PROT|nr:hypothetical protein [Nitrosomonas halophila]SDY21352.1 hypothetical protein SAMN05421881_102325 [Nitrosomonas halophila]
MTDTQPDKSLEVEDEILLDKLDSMLRRHRRESSSLMRAVEPAASGHADAVAILSDPSDPSQAIDGFASDTGQVPVLTDRVTLSINAWPAQSEISELLCFAFDAAIREAQIHLDPAERLTLLQALAKRLPKNF